MWADVVARARAMASECVCVKGKREAREKKTL